MLNNNVNNMNKKKEFSLLFTSILSIIVLVSMILASYFLGYFDLSNLEIENGSLEKRVKNRENYEYGDDAKKARDLIETEIKNNYDLKNICEVSNSIVKILKENKGKIEFFEKCNEKVCKATEVAGIAEEEFITLNETLNNNSDVSLFSTNCFKLSNSLAACDNAADNNDINAKCGFKEGSCFNVTLFKYNKFKETIKNNATDTDCANYDKIIDFYLDDIYVVNDEKLKNLMDLIKAKDEKVFEEKIANIKSEKKEKDSPKKKPEVKKNDLKKDAKNNKDRQAPEAAMNAAPANNKTVNIDVGAL